MSDILIIIVNFVIVDFLWFSRTEQLAEIFYVFFFFTPLLGVIYFYWKQNCKAIKTLVGMVLINILFFNTVLIAHNELTLTFVLINASFIVMLYVFTYMQHTWNNGCLCTSSQVRKFCTGMLLFVSILLSVVYEYFLKHHVNL